MCLFNEFAQQ
jgi:hypothetical protein